MRQNDYPITVLPDIEMYGGENEPWQVQILHDNGTKYLISEVTGYSAILSIIPFEYSAGLGVVGATPVLTINATFREYETDKAMAVFSFTIADTLNLSGKYVYQIELASNSNKRIGQGYLFIRNNINR